jgi:hypothetical protein
MSTTQAAALNYLLQSNGSAQTFETSQPERRDNQVKRRPCVVMKGGDEPFICVMATFGAAMYSQLSEVIKLFSLPFWPISDMLPYDVARQHVHSTPDMVSPDVNLKYHYKHHWRYVVLYRFKHTGALYRPYENDPYAIRRFSRQEVDKINAATVDVIVKITQTRLKRPHYIDELVQGYMVGLHGRYFVTLLKLLGTIRNELCTIMPGHHPLSVVHLLAWVTFRSVSDLHVVLI